MSALDGSMTVLGCTDSTNTRLKELARQGAPEGTVLLALRQTAGRGRMGRSFLSPENGLYMSVLLRPDCAVERLPTLTPCAALAVCRALLTVCGVEAAIKWPNDLLINGKKLCGILTEGVMTPDGRMAAVIGIGLNLNSSAADFPEELRGAVCSVRDVTGAETDECSLAEAILYQLDDVYARWCAKDGSLAEEYRAKCVTLGNDVTVFRNGSSRPAKALDIDADFSLLAEYPNGSRENIRFGEVSIR